MVKNISAINHNLSFLQWDKSIFNGLSYLQNFQTIEKKVYLPLGHWTYHLIIIWCSRFCFWFWIFIPGTCSFKSLTCLDLIMLHLSYKDLNLLLLNLLKPKTQFSSLVHQIITPQLINYISRVLQKLLKDFNGTAISIS